MNFTQGVENLMTWTGAALRGLVVGSVLVAGAFGAASGAAADTTVPTRNLSATGTITQPTYQTYTDSSTGTSPAHVTITLTQLTAFGFAMKSVFSDDTSGAKLVSNDAATSDIGSLNGSITWNNEDFDVYDATYAYHDAGSYLVTDTVTDSNGATATAEVEVSTLGSEYSTVTPTRILDTRDGTGTAEGKVGANSIVKLRVEGAGPIPSSGVTAVVLNVTVVATTGAGFITVYPSDDGTSAPKTSNLNYTADKTVANFVTVPVGKDGYVYLANSGPPAGPVDLIADVSGYYSRSATQKYEQEESPSRLLDTRIGTGAPKAAVPAGGTVKLLVALGDTYLPPPGYISAVAVNITAVDPSGNGFVTAYADGTARPATSTLNYHTGQTVANSAIVPVAANGEIDLTNEMTTAGSANLLVDVVGYYSLNGNFASDAFVPIAPSRVFDSRRDGDGQIENGIVYDLALGEWANAADSIEMNVTVAGEKSNGFLTLFNYGVPVPRTSNLNWTTGQNLANAAFVFPSEGDGWISLYNGGSAGADVILDVFGVFQPGDTNQVEV